MKRLSPFRTEEITVNAASTSPDDRCRHTSLRSGLHRFAYALPPGLRETYAEAFLRRAQAPAPAAEHAFQYLRDLRGSKCATAKGADNFYQRQYRQYLNPAMSVFASTARMAALAAGGPAQGYLWGHRRPVAMAMAEPCGGVPPILVLDHQTVAVALFLPHPANEAESRSVAEWLAGRGPIPEPYARLIEGESVCAAEPGVRATMQSAVGAMIGLAEATLASRKLAVLALHPYDPDAMGLHITLFGVDAVEPSRLESEHGLETDALAPWRRAAEETDTCVYFLVGGVEEAFTQCSQNLFVKRPRRDAPNGRSAYLHWTPRQPIDRLLGHQFEMFQGTVSASGLPGVSPRNGEYGMAAFSVRSGDHSYVLTPYFAGNFVHGHAAKIWTNPWSTMLLRDDHFFLTTATVSGPSRVIEHAEVTMRYPFVAELLGARRRRDGAPAHDPEYWFEQKVSEIRWRDEPVAANWLESARAPCSLSAGGLAHHGKKPAYFDADSLPVFDMALQHERERAGRPLDPSGDARRQWLRTCSEALIARQAYLSDLDIR